jgi:ribosomal protein S18 acetylase RimI-like enzyme
MAQEVSLQPATWRDFRSIYALEKICFQRDAWPWIDVLAALTFPETVRIKAVLGEQVIGFVIGDRRSRQKVGWIASICVHPDMRRKGIGYLLLNACEEEVGMPRMRLALRPSNQIAKRLYQRAGYVEVDYWERYYANGEDALVMEKAIVGNPEVNKSC